MHVHEISDDIQVHVLGVFYHLPLVPASIDMHMYIVYFWIKYVRLRQMYYAPTVRSDCRSWTGVRTHHLQITTVHFMSLRCLL